VGESGGFAGLAGAAEEALADGGVEDFELPGVGEEAGGLGEVGWMEEGDGGVGEAHGRRVAVAFALGKVRWCGVWGRGGERG